MLLSAAAARAALRRLSLQSIQRRWMLRQISSVQAPIATPPTHNHSSLFSFRMYARMARRIPPLRPDNYSDSEPDKEENEEEMDVTKERGDEPTEWEGIMFDFGSNEDSDPAEDEEESK